MEYFCEWKCNVLDKFNVELYKYLNNNHSIFLNQLKSQIQNLQKKFVITYVGKSSNKYVCFYLQVQCLTRLTLVLFKKNM